MSEELPILGQGKPCGDCSLCCKLLAVKELNKPMGKWCDHFSAGVGCIVYEKKPPTCSEFICLWKASPHLVPKLRPDRSGVVFFTAGTDPEEKVLQAHVDPRRPEAWKATKEIRVLLSILINQGFTIAVTVGEKRFALNKDLLETFKSMKEQGLDPMA